MCLYTVTHGVMELNTPWKPIIIVNHAMSSWLKYGHDICFSNIFLQDVDKESRSDSNNADCQPAAWITVKQVIGKLTESNDITNNYN